MTTSLPEQEYYSSETIKAYLKTEKVSTNCPNNTEVFEEIA